LSFSFGGPRRDFARTLDAQERPARHKIAHRPVYHAPFRIA
jgi:hypothetical protein